MIRAWLTMQCHQLRPQGVEMVESIACIPDDSPHVFSIHIVGIDHWTKARFDREHFPTTSIISRDTCFLQACIVICPIVLDGFALVVDRTTFTWFPLFVCARKRSQSTDGRSQGLVGLLTFFSDSLHRRCQPCRGRREGSGCSTSIDNHIFSLLSRFCFWVFRVVAA